MQGAQRPTPGVLKCDTCQTSVPSVSWTEHLNGRKHLRMLDTQQTKIFVTGFRQGTLESSLATYFGKFAAIKEVNIDKEGFAVIHVHNRSSTDRICSQKHSLDGLQLKVKPHKIEMTSTSKSKLTSKSKSKKRQKTKENSEIDELEISVMKQMSTFETVDTQMRFLADHMGLDANDYAIREEIRSSLETVFRKFFPGFMLSPFGSSANRFGIKGSSDLDLFMDFGFQPSHNKVSSVQRRSLKQILKNLHKIWLGQDASALKDLQRLDPIELLVLISNIIQRCTTGYEKVFALKKARCPIVMCIHSKSGMKCDLSMKNRLALFNTELLLVYQRLDPRVHPLIFTVRFWGKKGCIVSAHLLRLSSYTLSMLVVFYLQNTVPPVLPTVEHLQLLAEKQPLEVNGWPCHICSDIQKIAKTSNVDDLETLLKGFFRFYSNIDFESTVICIRTGKMVALDRFMKESPGVVEAQFKSNMHVQDPFELAHNIARTASKDCVQKIMEHAANAYEFMSPRMFGAPFDLVALFDEANELGLRKHKKKNSMSMGPPVRQRPSHPVVTPPETIGTSTALLVTDPPTLPTPMRSITSAPSITDNTSEFQVILSDSSLNLARELQQMSFENDFQRNAFLGRLSSKIREVFSVALRFDCRDINNDDDCSASAANNIHPNKRRSDELVTSPNKMRVVMKEDGQYCPSVSPVALLTFPCRIRHRTWDGRRGARMELNEMNIDQHLEPILIEAAVSDRILTADDDFEGYYSTPPIFTLDCTLLPLQSNALGLTVRLSLINFSDTCLNEFKTCVVPFLRSYVPQIVNESFFYD